MIRHRESTTVTASEMFTGGTIENIRQFCPGLMTGTDGFRELESKRLRSGTTDVVETSLLLPIELFHALESMAKDHQMTVGRMTRVLIGMYIVSRSLVEEVPQTNVAKQ